MSWFGKKKKEQTPSELAIHLDQEEYFAKYGKFKQTPYVDVYEAPGLEPGTSVHGYIIKEK